MVLGRVEVTLSFDVLIEQVVKDPWWRGNKAYLVDDKGNVLVGTSTTGVEGDSIVGVFGKT